MCVEILKNILFYINTSEINNIQNKQTNKVQEKWKGQAEEKSCDERTQQNMTVVKKPQSSRLIYFGEI